MSAAMAAAPTQLLPTSAGRTENVLLISVRTAVIATVVTVQLLHAGYFSYAAYAIRIYPIKEVAMTIHKVDPWFNYRATEYLAESWLGNFFTWYDYESWDPLGRPVGHAGRCRSRGPTRLVSARPPRRRNGRRCGTSKMSSTMVVLFSSANRN